MTQGPQEHKPQDLWTGTDATERVPPKGRRGTLCRARGGAAPGATSEGQKRIRKMKD